MPAPDLAARMAERAARRIGARKGALHDAWLAYLRGRGVELGDRCWVAVGSQVERGTRIGHDTRINGPISIRGAGAATIGPFCAIGRRVTILTENHATNLPNVQFKLHRALKLPEAAMVAAADVEIGPACWLGDGVTVLAGVRIGAGAVVAAGATVSRDVAPFALAAGVPARELRRRCSEEVAEALLQTAWWEWPRERLLRNREFFASDIAALTAQELRARIRP